MTKEVDFIHEIRALAVDAATQRSYEVATLLYLSVDIIQSGRTAEFTDVWLKYSQEKLVAPRERGGAERAGEKEARSPRIYEPFLVRVRGTDANGDAFETETVLDNMAAGGLYLKLPRQVEKGSELEVVVRLTQDPDYRNPATCIIAHAEVLRVDDAPDGKCGVAVTFKDSKLE